ncbi:hypothetical protein OOK31_38450 [Streptomyces sp. NBC_00249]|uniref:hypothetical protein n=1 Tax=Streptomyces sp. NBC_00249 TaxID=2975690 RepID=UPI002250ED91|nr:hypothetical protein [Streptomyces sp. NBC_00249]MCX5199693.1 hypothetical protein [Streptomyces sp. NBC_00249]
MSDINPMEQAAGQAAQTAAITLKILVMIAQAVREHHQREAAQRAVAPAPPPTPARQLADPDHERYAHLVRGTVLPPAVAEAVVSSPQWSQLADELKRLEAAGVNVAQFLGDAAPVIARMDADLRAGATAPGVTATAAATQPRNPWAPSPGQESRRSDEARAGMGQRIREGGRDLLDRARGRQKPVLGDRADELARLGIGPQENARLVILARESLASEDTLGRLVTSREWPAIASQMKELHAAGHNPREALAGIPVRMRQAADAGIRLTPADAARGLLGDLAKTPPAATAATAAPATAAPATATAAPAPVAPVAPVAPATAAPATDKVRYDWSITTQGETNAETVRAGTVLVPRGLADSEVKDLAVKELTGATRHLGSGNPGLHGYSFSAQEQGKDLPGYTGNRVTMSGADVRRARDAGPTLSVPDARASAAAAQSTTAVPGVRPLPGPAAAPVAPVARPVQTRTHGR